MENGRVTTCGNRIKIALIKRGMKQSDLCQITKIPKSAISQYISGAFEPKQDRIYLISKALNVSEAWLLGFDVPMERIKTTPAEPELSEVDKRLLELFRLVEPERRRHILASFEAQLKAMGLIPEDYK